MNEGHGLNAKPGQVPGTPPVERGPSGRSLSRLQEMCAAGLLVLLDLLLLDAVIETFLSETPMRWLVAGAAAGFLLFSLLLLRRLQWATQASVSGLFLVALIAATAWLPSGLSAGVVLLHLPTSAVLSAVTALAVLAASIVVLRLPFVPKAARAVFALLALYGIAGFVFGLKAGTPYTDLFHGQSFWGRLPFWLQGASIGGLVVVPLALLIGIAYGALRVRDDRFRGWTVQVLALGLCLFIPAATFKHSIAPRHAPPAHVSQPVIPAPALKLSAELPWEQLYAGDPLRVRVRLASPRAMQEAHRIAQKLERREQASAPAFVPPPLTSSDWPRRVTFQLYKFQPGGSRQAALTDADWQTFLRQTKERIPGVRLGVLALSEEWIIPPDIVGQLGAGRFSLEVTWSGKDLVHGSLLDRDGTVRAVAVNFAIQAASDDRQRAAHEERLAFFDFLQQRYKEARTHGEEALRLDPGGFSPQRAQTYLLVADCSVRLGEPGVARKTYQALLKRLPPPEQNDLALAVSERLGILSREGGER